LTRSVPQIVSMAGIVIGILLFVVTLLYIDIGDTIDSAKRLGLALPLILLPSTAWHLLRTWGWSLAFPDSTRPAFTRLFRVRLAADAISFFTVRGIAGEPLKVVLLYDRVPAPVSTAAIALERLAFAIIGVVMAGGISYFAVRRLAMPAAWDRLFTATSIGAIVVLGVFVLIARRRTGDYLGRTITLLDRLTGRRLEASRIIAFLLEVEHVLLDLLRGDRRRLVILTCLPIVCYLIMALEVWLALWAVGEPIGVTAALTIETIARLGSIASAAIPGNMGALEASNAMPVAMLGLGGGGALALARRVRSLLWAGVGLALYPRIESKRTESHVP
jgi:glycosyltransferase 2 family protein